MKKSTFTITELQVSENANRQVGAFRAYRMKKEGTDIEAIAMFSENTKNVVMTILKVKNGTPVRVFQREATIENVKKEYYDFFIALYEFEDRRAKRKIAKIIDGIEEAVGVGLAIGFTTVAVFGAYFWGVGIEETSRILDALEKIFKF